MNVGKVRSDFFCDRAEQIDPSNWRIYNNRASALMGRGLVNQAISEFRRGLSVRPTAGPWSTRGSDRPISTAVKWLSWRAGCRKMDVDYVLMSTATPVDISLMAYLAARQRFASRGQRSGARNR